MFFFNCCMFWPDWVIIRIVKYILYSYCYHCMDRDLFLTVTLIVLKFILMLLKQCNRIVFQSYFRIQVKFVSYQTPQQRWLDSSLITLLFLPQIIIALIWIWRSRTQQFANHQEFAEYYFKGSFWDTLSVVHGCVLHEVYFLFFEFREEFCQN